MTQFILVPVINTDNKENSIFIRAYSSKHGSIDEERLRALSKGYTSPVSLQLLRANLNSHGDIAAERVKAYLNKLHLDFDWVDQQRLYVEGESADGSSLRLGLALALLFRDREEDDFGIIATGDLGGYNDGIDILPIAHLQEKLELAYREKERGKLPFEKYVFFAPETFIDSQGHPQVTEVTLKEEIAKLAQKHINIEVKPVATIKMVMDYFNKNIKAPYLGLSSFQFKEEDVKRFFGRSKEVEDALAKLHGGNIRGCYRWLQIEGNSGVGKSSLVHAGILTKIKGNQKTKGALVEPTGYKHWKFGSMTPGEKPLENLAIATQKLIRAEENYQEALALRGQLKKEEGSLRIFINGHKDKNNDTSYVLVIDQFEELFTFSDKEEQHLFDARLTEAITGDCPLFIITTVRIDFLDSFEQLPLLLNISSTQCQRYLLPPISQQGLREVIEQPAKLCDIDTSEITELLLNDAKNEVGSLPLVENALNFLYEQRKDNRLSGKLYSESGGLAGLLEFRADKQLEALNEVLNEEGREGALELFLAMTRIDPEGQQHTRRDISQTAAQKIAGFGNQDRGQEIIDYLAGGKLKASKGIAKNQGGLRLITSINKGSGDKPDIYYNLIHETLIRARVDGSNQLKPYWKTLHDYVDKNRNRYLYRQQLEQHAEQWHTKEGGHRWFNLASRRDLKLYKPFLSSLSAVEFSYLRLSRKVLWIKTGLALLTLPLMLMVANAIKVPKHNKIGEFDQITLEPLLDFEQLSDQVKSLQYKEKEPLSVMIVYSERAPYEEAIVNSFIKSLESKVGELDISDVGPVFNIDGDKSPPGGSCLIKDEDAIKKAWSDQIEEVKNSTKTKKIDYFITLGTFVTTMIKGEGLVEKYNAKGIVFLGVTDPKKGELVDSYKNRKEENKITGVRYGTDNEEDYGNTINSLFLPNQKLVFVYDSTTYKQDGYVADNLKISKAGKAKRFDLRDKGVDNDGKKIYGVKIGAKDLVSNSTNDPQEVYFAWYGLDNILRDTTKSEGANILKNKWVIPSTYSTHNLEKAGIIVSISDQEVGKLGADIVFESYLHPKLPLGHVDIGTPNFKVWLDCKVIKNDKKGLKLASSPLLKTAVIEHPEDCPSVQDVASK
ncbi:MAG: hypothetical protein ABL933_03340 [Methyloglobulus sp.]|nr:hypothetical protein [Methyloglobulus sp.]